MIKTIRLRKNKNLFSLGNFVLQSNMDFLMIKNIDYVCLKYYLLINFNTY